MAEEQQDVETLKRRGRRRLVGAVALVLAAVIVLPMVFDSEPSGTAPPVTVRIPGENESSFNPKPPPKPKVEAKKIEAEPAKPVPDEKAQYVVQVGVFASPDSALKKLTGAKLPYYTEKQGNFTRVRAGPFASREAAEQALGKLKALGFKDAAVSAK